MNIERRHRNLERAAIALITICFLIWSAAFIYKSSFVAIDGQRRFCLSDDAMISMRYAWNLSHGLGLVWNPGERVEGYTNLLMTLVMSLSTSVFDQSAAVLSIQILGVAFVLGSAYLTMRIADHLTQEEKHEHRRLVRVLSFLGALFYYPLAYWSLMGMETGLLTLLFLLGVLSVLHYVRNPHLPWLLLGAVCLGLAFLTRPDSSVFACVAFAFTLLGTHKSRPFRRTLNHLVGAIGLYLLFVAGQTVFRWIYYGELLPNTYTLKVAGIPISSRIENGIGFIKPFLTESAPLFIVVIADVVLNFRKQKLLFATIACATIGYQIWVGGDPWPYWRIMAPFMPLMLVLFVNAISALMGALSSTTVYRTRFLRDPGSPRRHVPAVIVVLLMLLGLVLTNWSFLEELSFRRLPYLVEYSPITVNTAIAIDRLTTEDATIGVFWAGAIPYYSERVAVDFLGKSDKYIARLPPDLSGSTGGYGMNSVPGHSKYDLNYSIISLRPTYVQYFIWGSQDLSNWATSEYVTVEYKGLELRFLKDSPHVLWNETDKP